MLAKIFTYAWRWIVRPAEAAADQLYDKNNVWIGFWAVFILGVLYSTAALLLWLTGFRPEVRPILPVPRDSYYFWQIFFTLPWALLTWLLAGVMVHLWNYIFNRERRLNDILGPLGFAFVIPWFFFGWIPKAIVAPFLGPWLFPGWPDWVEIIRVALPALWMMVLFFISVRKVYRAGWLLALFSSILAAAVFTVMALVFMR